MLKITPVAPADRTAWEPLFRGYCAFYNSDPEPAIAPVWGWIGDPQSGLRAALARDASGRALGLVHWEVILRPLKGETICYIHDLFVDPEARGTGAGRALIAHVQARAREAGAGAVRLATQEGNATARRLYDQFAPASDFILYTFPI